MKAKSASPFECALSRPPIMLMSAALAALIGLCTSAHADLKLCNKTTSRIGVAIGYSDAAGGRTTEGWWTVPPQTCETLYKGPLTTRLWYIHAVDYDAGGGWVGPVFMCTIDKAFTIKGVQDCAKQGYNRTGFLAVDTEKSADWTIYLTEDSSEGGAKAK